MLREFLLVSALLASTMAHADNVEQLAISGVVTSATISTETQSGPTQVQVVRGAIVSQLGYVESVDILKRFNSPHATYSLPITIYTGGTVKYRIDALSASLTGSLYSPTPAGSFNYKPGASTLPIVLNKAGVYQVTYYNANNVALGYTTVRVHEQSAYEQTVRASISDGGDSTVGYTVSPREGYPDYAVGVTYHQDEQDDKEVRVHASVSW